MADSTFSRRLSEFVGVALFAAALIWLIALVTHDAADPVWFFTTDTGEAPANFVGRVGAFVSELSLQLFGYAAFFLPALPAVGGLALLLVPEAGCGLHEGDRRRPAARLRQRLLQPRARQRRSWQARAFDAGGSVGAGLGWRSPNT